MYTPMEVLGLAPFVLVALAIVVDARTGRGFGLGILSFLLFVCTSLVAAYFILVAQQYRQEQPVAHGLAAAMLFGAFLLVAFLVAAYCTLSLLVGAAAVAGVAGQWLWLAGLVVAALVPVLAIGLPILSANVAQSPTSQGTDLLTMIRQPTSSALILIPQVTVFAYCIARLVRPVVPARQPASLT